MDAKQLVAAGASWLDQARPVWWWAIDTITLKPDNVLQCVLGQVFSSYSIASGLMSKFDGDFAPCPEMTDAEAFERGFIPDDRGEAEELRVEWCRVIHERRAPELETYGR